ncbi:MAG: NAD-dependent epimerase/dehydratase family protein [Planctomycetes bacterium]|nr:NAD-dependent epimerase/dehydratase family protein [Planctomycetota bacterium]
MTVRTGRSAAPRASIGAVRQDLREFHGRRVLVTGGAGFVGSHVVDLLVDGGASVRVLDDLSSGSVANLAAARERGAVEVQLGCVTRRADVRRAVAGVDLVLHLAAVVGVPVVLADPRRAARVNVRGTEEVLDAAARSGTAVVLTSSSEVYGDGGERPFAESDPVRPGATDDPRGSYACSKALAEWAVRAHVDATGMPAVVLRLFNTVGPRQRARSGMVLPRFVEQALRGLPLTVYGDGRQTRCFADVRDVARIVLGVALHPGAAGRTLNVGGDHEISIAELAVEVQRALGSAAGVVHARFDDAVSVRSADRRRRRPRLDALRALLGELPVRPLRDTILAVAAERGTRAAAALS